SNVTRVAERLDPVTLSRTQVHNERGHRRETVIVSEPGMYEVVIRSDKPDAARFRRWITAEVLPSIRKTGSYSVTDPVLPTGEKLLALAVVEAQRMLAVKDEVIAAKDEVIAELEPRAEVADRILDADGDLSVKDTAQSLTRAGVKVGQNRLFGDLARRGWISRAGDGRYRVKQAAIESGYMSVLPQSHYHPRTGVLVLDPPQPRVTPKGLQKLLSDFGGPLALPVVPV
ncbi:phage antirepressor KilAC domain-containing protein, partial [Prescottella agglutinans]